MKKVRITTSGKSTGVGAYSNQWMYSLSEKKEIKPVRTEYSRTGNHWTHTWHLLPGEYLEVDVEISGGGHHYCGCQKLIVHENGEYQYTQWEGSLPDFVDPTCDCEAFCEVVEGVEV